MDPPTLPLHYSEPWLEGQLTFAKVRIFNLVSARIATHRTARHEPCQQTLRRPPGAATVRIGKVGQPTEMGRAMPDGLMIARSSQSDVRQPRNLVRIDSTGIKGVAIIPTTENEEERVDRCTRSLHGPSKMNGFQPERVQLTLVANTKGLYGDIS